MFEIKVEAKNVMSALERLAHTGQDMSPVMRVIAQELDRQTEKNFAAEGRPKWLGIKPRKGREGGRILQDTGQLAASITTSHDSHSAMIGTNKVYAAIHQFGGKTGRDHKVTMPARPFLPIDAQGQLQPEAEENILGLVNDYLSRVIG